MMQLSHDELAEAIRWRAKQNRRLRSFALAYEGLYWTGQVSLLGGVLVNIIAEARGACWPAWAAWLPIVIAATLWPIWREIHDRRMAFMDEDLKRLRRLACGDTNAMREAP